MFAFGLILCLGNASRIVWSWPFVLPGWVALFFITVNQVLVRLWARVPELVFGFTVRGGRLTGSGQCAPDADRGPSFGRMSDRETVRSLNALHSAGGWAPAVGRRGFRDVCERWCRLDPGWIAQAIDRVAIRRYRVVQALRLVRGARSKIVPGSCSDLGLNPGLRMVSVHGEARSCGTSRGGVSGYRV